MAEIIYMPKLSDTMEEGTVIKWNKKIGDKVSEGDILAEIETDKAIQDFEIDVSGVLLFIGVKEGEKTRVNEILAILGEEGEDISSLIKKSFSLKKEEKIVLEKKENRVFISPLAKKMAKEIGMSTDKIKGSGDNSRIIKRDIEKTSENNDQIIILSSIRKKIAENLTHSKFTAPHYYLFIEVNTEKMIHLRKNLNDKLPTEEKISFNDLLVKAVAKSLRKHPNVNTSWKEKEIIYHSNINVGVAVAIKEGLIVPVIKNTDQKSLLQISQEIKDKSLRSRLRKIKPEEMENSTFTVSNLGMYGIEFFTSIINLPNSSILSIGTIMEKPVVKDSKIEIGHVMKLTLSCDHRIIDGSTGSNFLQFLKNMLEDPMGILV
ncbi:MAG: 2-oxo acid dehydrogenase subunit E2 [Flavobacteriales bacterium]|jgi:pyruvate dehydrogenase E2 component (dihydrolipoamide acetyltransferase)|uniref:dihydrolipoamide acetyltransferase family protein n=1 Tax=Blattabacterium sp. (Mastotermes darwiniensis) TaxID=39768 RepID=UPI000231DEED|nr:dihydrolipoamide acetyltransferase family protein [Blattabacterium sp. (Mastotermes darwiniensis)]AER40801.1 dihydrolipoamide acyltransferase E2 component [Blattabacterium sp. (Mastotermes darwiniensis) str. MADAR]MDR1804646.1 2-oxo acid dehydrogenase subunit E2 [Flavobacteriales bacterium]